MAGFSLLNRLRSWGMRWTGLWRSFASCLGTAERAWGWKLSAGSLPGIPTGGRSSMLRPTRRGSGFGTVQRKFMNQKK